MTDWLRFSRRILPGLARSRESVWVKDSVWKGTFVHREIVSCILPVVVKIKYKRKGVSWEMRIFSKISMIITLNCSAFYIGQRTVLVKTAVIMCCCIAQIQKKMTIRQ